MFPEVHSVLKLDQKGLRGFFVNILEESEQCGSFLIHHFLSHGLKSGKSVLFLGLEQSLGHYHAVGMKLGVNVQKAKESGQLIFFEGLKMIGEAYGGQDSAFNFISGPCQDPLKRLCLEIRDHVQKHSQDHPGKEMMIILDKLSLFQTLGVSVHDIAIFTKYLHQIASASSGTLGTLVRKDPEDDVSSEELTNYLLENSDLSIWTWPLRTGKSSSVSGNLEFQWLDRSESGRYQFSVEDKNVRVFALGASNAVL